MSRRRARLGALAAGLTSLSLAAVPTVVPQASAVEPVSARQGVDQWWYDALNIDKAQRQATGKGVVVAVFDGFLDPTVPDLRGADIEIKRNCRGQKMPLYTGERTDHGTAMVTAIVGQGTGNAEGGQGVRGIAPDATIRYYPNDVIPDNDIAECDTYTGADQIVQAARDGADIISLSLGGFTPRITKALDRAREYGAVVVAAAGQRRGVFKQIEYPGASPGVVAILAADQQGRPWSGNPVANPDFNNFATLTVPGVGIEIGGYDPSTGGWVSGAPRTGTSAPTALAAGAFAVLKSKWPDATNNQLIQAMVHQTSNVDGGELRYEPSVAFGYLSLTRALAVDPTGYPDENPLLIPPRQAMKKYPASVYDGGQDATDGSASAQPSGQAQPAQEATPAAGQSEDTSGAGGPPVALLVGGGIALALLAAAAVAARRQAGRDAPQTSASAPGSPGADDHRDQGDR